MRTFVRNAVTLAVVTCILGACSKSDDAQRASATPPAAAAPRTATPPAASPPSPSAPAQMPLIDPAKPVAFSTDCCAETCQPSSSVPNKCTGADPQAVGDARCFKYRENCMEVGYIATTEKLEGTNSDKLQNISAEVQHQCDIGPKNWDNCSGYCGVLYWGRGIAKNQSKAAALARSICAAKDGEACNELAAYDALGVDGKTNLGEALSSLTKACSLGAGETSFTAAACAQVKTLSSYLDATKQPRK